MTFRLPGKYLPLLAVAALPIAALAAQSDEGPPRWAANIARKQFVVMQGLPAPYAAMHDTSRDTPAKLQRGKVLFEGHCASCHGWNGQGTGPEAFALVPAPADLEWLARTPKGRSDPYIYWSIAEGGGQFESEMPSFKRQLAKKDIWALVAYIRAGMPRATP